MPRLRLLILDANVVIYLHELGLWETITAGCEVHLSRIVIDKEVQFYEDGRGHLIPINLSQDEQEGRLTVFEVELGDIRRFQKRFDPTYFERLDPGEAESLAFMLKSNQGFLISSADSIVYKVLGNLNMGDQGISLEEILQRIGRSRSDLPWQYRKQFRKKYTQDGQRDSITGLGDKKPRG